MSVGTVTELHWAAARDDVDAIETQLDTGSEVDAADNKGKTPLHWAANRGATKAAALLLASGANVNARHLYSETPLHFAARKNHLPMVELLLNNGAEINAFAAGHTPLHWAAYNGHTTMVECLLKRGADVNADNGDGTPLHEATHNQQIATANLLLSHGADIHAQDEGATPMDVAVARKMNPFETHILGRVTHAMTRLEFKSVHPEAEKGGEPQSASDIYALSFYIWGEEDDPRRIILEVSYNTEACYKSCVPSPEKKSGWPIASSDAEAKWNYAFWLQKPFIVIGASDDPKDEIGIELRQEWIAKEGLSYTDEEEEEDFDRTLELDQQIERRFWQTCTRVARRLHDDGLITSTFGRAIPIIVHDLDFDDDSFDHTRNANPDGVAADFLKGF